MRAPSSSWPWRPALLAVVLACAPFARAQLVKVGGGSSDLYDAQGASIELQGGKYDGYLGAGDMGGEFRLGSRASTDFHSGRLTVGDDPLNLQLPTDIFEASHYFLSRGISYSTHQRSFDLQAFGGTTAVSNGAPFFQAATVDTPAAMLFFDVPVSERVRLYSRDVFSTQQTVINGVTFQARPGLKLGAAAGIGSDDPYGAASLQLKNDWLDLQAAYIDSGARFRRITVQAPLSPEYDRENILATFKPRTAMVFVLGHQNLLQPQSDSRQPFERASVDQAQAGFDFHQFRWGGGVFESLLRAQRTVGQALWAARPVTRWLQAGMNYYRSRSQGQEISSVISGNVQETVSPRLNLLQVISSSNGQTTVSFGGHYFSNLFTAGVDYETVYVPFLRQPFQRGMDITLQIHPFGAVELNGQTFLDPQGKLKYTASGSTMFSAASRLLGVNGSSTYRLPKYIIRGRVVDDHGQAIPGAAVRVDGQVLLTNAAGQFFVRKSRAASYSLQVAFSDFVNPLSYEVVFCPATVTAMREEVAAESLVTLRRAGPRNAKSKMH